MYAAVSRFWSRGLARVRGSKLSTLVKKSPNEANAAVAAEVASIAACKASSKVSHPVFKKKHEDLLLLNAQMQKSSVRYEKFLQQQHAMYLFAKYP